MVVAGGGAPCPRCGQIDAVQRVPAIVASQSSQLSWELAAPAPPGMTVRRRSSGGTPGWVWAVAVIVLVTLPVDLVLFVVVAAIAIAYAVVIVAAACIAAVGFVLYRYLNRHAIAERRERERRQREDAARRYHHALTYWNQLQYCHRCYGIFLPGHEWQYEEVTIRGELAVPAHAWALAVQLADYADKVHAPEILKLDDA